MILTVATPRVVAHRPSTRPRSEFAQGGLSNVEGRGTAVPLPASGRRTRAGATPADTPRHSDNYSHIGAGRHLTPRSCADAAEPQLEPGWTPGAADAYARHVSVFGYAALAGVGFIAAVLNVVAAGGSFLTLPLLIFLGLPAPVANGTNRVGVLAQNLSAVAGFHRHQVLPLRWALGVSVPAVAGAALGAWAALHVTDFAFRRILSIAMLAFTLLTLLNRGRSPRPERDLTSAGNPSMMAGFFVTGVYGGFLQAGVGFLLLAMTTLAGLDLVRGNAVKVFAVMLLTLLSLGIFAGAGQVDWPAGLALAVGNLLGGAAGVRLAVQRGHRWLERVVTATVILFAILLWVQ
jgi:uncharacterized protein